MNTRNSNKGSTIHWIRGRKIYNCFAHHDDDVRELQQVRRRSDLSMNEQRANE